jgi:hypothetical protein
MAGYAFRSEYLRPYSIDGRYAISHLIAHTLSLIQYNDLSVHPDYKWQAIKLKEVSRCNLLEAKCVEGFVKPPETGERSFAERFPY